MLNTDIVYGYDSSNHRMHKKERLEIDLPICCVDTAYLFLSNVRRFLNGIIIDAVNSDQRLEHLLLFARAPPKYCQMMESLCIFIRC